MSIRGKYECKEINYCIFFFERKRRFKHEMAEQSALLERGLRSRRLHKFSCRHLH